MLKAVQVGKKAERMVKEIKYLRVYNIVSTDQRQISVGRARGYIWNLTGREKKHNEVEVRGYELVSWLWNLTF